ncbi:4Fe-4S dicluster domain-containing protein [Candidatus Woesearchaeota archaeon]|nr:4Fe-4S dicluster domain-containing protein [Candidatus Woesearchaeota archaeon]
MAHKNLEQCNECGICNSSCPAYFVLRKESVSPRHKVKLAREGIISEAFQLCTDCDTCFQNCPVKVKIDLESMREDLVRQGKETDANKRMKQNIQKFGNSLGDLKKTKNIKQFYT